MGINATAWVVQFILWWIGILLIASTSPRIAVGVFLILCVQISAKFKYNKD